MAVPSIRLRDLNAAPIREDGAFVLYWMVAFRRPHWNFALEHAVDESTRLGVPLVVLEALRLGYRWASDRLHRFIVDGMQAHREHYGATKAIYYPYLEREPGEGSGLLEALCKNACLVIGDEYPCFFIPKMQSVAAERVPVRLRVVDSNGLLPLRAADKVFTRAFSLRRHLQKVLPEHLVAFPAPEPLDALSIAPDQSAQATVADCQRRWPAASEAELDGGTISSLPIDHTVGLTESQGGFRAGETAALRFLNGGIERYAEERNHPDADASSRLSPWLHFGHVSVHQVFYELAQNEGWSLESVSSKVTGSREGWWGVGPNAEAFLDELVTWRELGFNMCAHDPAGYARYESLPGWARETLEAHAADPRPHHYTLQQLEAGETYDPVWNAAQAELRETGRLHNYLRMLWGKKILEWTRNPEEALAIMIELNNKYALDGRDPNSYSGIFWVLGRYDRAWGPERPIFGKIRYMSSESAQRKLKMREYLARFGAQPSLL